MNKQKTRDNALFYRILFYAAVCLVIYVRLRLAGTPLDRDEGEYAYAGQLAFRGIPPYMMAYNMKLPGIYWIYALIMAVFGQTDFGIRAGMLVINIVTAALVYSTGRKLMDEKAGLAAGACFLIVMLAPVMDGVFGCAEHVVILFAMAGLRMLLHAIDSGKKRWYEAAGLLLGVSVIVRQHGIFFLGAGLIYSVWANRGNGLKNVLLKSGLLALVSALPFAAMCAYIYASGVSANFFFWVFQYGGKYAGVLGLNKGLGFLGMFLEAFFRYEFPVLLFAMAGLAAAFMVKKTRKTAVLLLLFFIVSFGAVCVGFYFRTHYFIGSSWFRVGDFLTF